MRWTRRDFLKTTSAATMGFVLPLQAYPGRRAIVSPGNPKQSETLRVKGSYREIGYQVGKQMGKNIRTLIKLRKPWHDSLLKTFNSKTGKSYAAELKRLTKKHFPHLMEEIEGMAEGAGLAFKAVWVMCIKSEMESLSELNPGCSTISFRTKNQLWFFHNEDGHEAYRDIMFILDATPPSNVRFISMVYPGIIPGNGPAMNNQGLIQSTNYIGTVNPQPGIPRYIIGRAILEAKTIDEATGLATMTPRAHPYHHNLASISEKAYYSVETTPDRHHINEPVNLYYHTNHLILKKTRSYPYEDQAYKSSSSMSRFKVIRNAAHALSGKPPTREWAFNVLGSHESKPYSPCRHPEGDVMGRTLGTAFFDINKGSFRLYRGNPCTAKREELYRDITFSSQGG